MNNFHSSSIIVIAMLMVYSVAYSESKVYKYIDENGKVIYTSIPPNDSKKVEVLELKETNTIPADQIKVKQNKVKQQHDNVSNRIKQRISDREKRAAEIETAKQVVAQKKEALKNAEVALPGERIGNVFTRKARLTQAYFDRVQVYKDELASAERELKELQRKKK